MTRALVTGGVGFIGSHVSRALLLRGEDVNILDDFSNAPYPTAYKERNLADLQREFGKRVTLFRGCVTERALAEKAIDGCERVIHLAGLAGVRPSFQRPADYARVNVEGTALIAQLTIASGIRKLAVASSSSVYGNSTPLPAREDAPCIAPESPYAASKRGAELLLHAYTKSCPDLRCAALRFFTVYGARQRPEMAITLFTRAMLEGRSITVFGDGSMRRDFTHVDDITRGVLAASDQCPRGFRAYNLGSGNPITLGDLVTALTKATGTAPVIERAPQPLGDVDATFADISRAESELGWKPEIHIERGLMTVVDWVRHNA
ncbi:MAG: NAD-dependent epimerase/dehydratase family protein [Polyangiaceae bacterium]